MNEAAAARGDRVAGCVRDGAVVSVLAAAIAAAVAEDTRRGVDVTVGGVCVAGSVCEGVAGTTRGGAGATARGVCVAESVREGEKMLAVAANEVVFGA